MKLSTRFRAFLAVVLVTLIVIPALADAVELDNQIDWDWLMCALGGPCSVWISEGCSNGCQTCLNTLNGSVCEYANNQSGSCDCKLTSLGNGAVLCSRSGAACYGTTVTP